MKRTLLILLAILTSGFSSAQTASQTLSLSVMPSDTLEVVGAPTTVFYPALYSPLYSAGADSDAAGFDASLNARSISSVAAGRLSFVSNQGDRKITVALNRDLPAGLELMLSTTAEGWGGSSARLSATAVDLVTRTQLDRRAGGGIGYTLVLSGMPTAVGTLEAGLETQNSRTVIFTLAQAN